MSTSLMKFLLAGVIFALAGGPTAQLAAAPFRFHRSLA